MRLEVFKGQQRPWGLRARDAFARDAAASGGTTQLMRAASAGLVDAVIEVVVASGKAASFINAVDSNGWTAVSHAAHRGHWLVVWLLVNKLGADPALAAGAPIPDAVAAALAKGQRFAAAAEEIVAEQDRMLEIARKAAMTTGKLQAATAATGEETLRDEAAMASTATGLETLHITRDDNTLAGFSIFQNELVTTDVTDYALAMGVREGMHITHINGNRIHCWDDYVRNAHGRKTFTMTVRRE
jgi:hypothetical protein